MPANRTWLPFVALALFTAAQAHAGYTAVAPCVYDSELGHAAILSNAYGGNFVADGLNFTNGTVTATRCDDAGGEYADQLWTSNLLSAKALARFGGFEQTLGIVAGKTGGLLQELFTLNGTGLNVAGSVNALNLEGKTFRFARGGEGELATSLDADNILGHDQMVSYRLTGPNSLDRYVLFFEDATNAQHSDWDFNDMVVEVSNTVPQAIPLPQAAYSGLAILLSGGLWNARARVRAWFK